MTFARSSVCVLALALFAPGCSTLHDDIHVEVRANPGIDFEVRRTYAWAAAAAAIRDPDQEWAAPDMDIGSEIRYLVDRELRSRELTEVVDDPDMYVIYGVGVDMKSLDVVADPDDGTERFEQVPKGAVFVVLVDPGTRRVLWYGAADGEIEPGRTIEDSKQRLDYAISKMFDESPL